LVVSVRVKFFEIPARVAVSTSVRSTSTAAVAVAVKVPLLCPLPMLRLPGTVRLESLLVRVTFRPPDGAAAVRLTVQVDVPGAFTLAGEQLRALIWAPVVKVKLKVADALWPLSVAVTVAFWLVATVPVVAEKVALF
jgi:hypothetical protein